jgi:L-2-hydroxycarboxylate dehydrogenase (NAD+)
MIGFGFTTATASIAPWGAREALVGNNPPAWALPTQVVPPGAELPPADADSMFLDIALSVVAGNRLDIYRRRGEPLPNNTWALDEKGEPTTDPSARQNGGSYAPLTQYKGSGMAIVLAAINNFLSGNVYDDARMEAQGGAISGTTSHWFTAYDVAQFVDPAQFTREVRELRDRIHATTPRAGFERVYAPGDLENEMARKYITNGIPLEQFTVDELHWVAERTGIPWDLPGKS